MGDIFDLISESGDIFIRLWDSFKWFIIPIFIGACWWFIWRG